MVELKKPGRPVKKPEDRMVHMSVHFTRGQLAWIESHGGRPAIRALVELARTDNLDCWENVKSK